MNMKWLWDNGLAIVILICVLSLIECLVGIGLIVLGVYLAYQSFDLTYCFLMIAAGPILVWHGNRALSRNLG